MSGYYPAGLTDSSPNTPWNEEEIPEKDFTVDVTFTMTKRVNITTNDYIPEVIIEDERIVEPASTSDTDWSKAYEENHYTIEDLLLELETYIKQDLERYKGNSARERQLKEMLEDCQNWETYDTDFTEV